MESDVKKWCSVLTNLNLLEIKTNSNLTNMMQKNGKSANSYINRGPRSQSVHKHGPCAKK